MFWILWSVRESASFILTHGKKVKDRHAKRPRGAVDLSIYRPTRHKQTVANVTSVAKWHLIMVAKVPPTSKQDKLETIGKVKTADDVTALTYFPQPSGSIEGHEKIPPFLRIHSTGLFWSFKECRESAISRLSRPNQIGAIQLNWQRLDSN